MCCSWTSEPLARNYGKISSFLLPAAPLQIIWAKHRTWWFNLKSTNSNNLGTSPTTQQSTSARITSHWFPVGCLCSACNDKMAIKHEETDWEERAEMQDGFHLQFTSNRKKELRMAACSINPGDRGSIMNSSSITQHPNDAPPWRPGNRQCSCWCSSAAMRGERSLTEEFRRWGYQHVGKVNEREVITRADVV